MTSGTNVNITIKLDDDREFSKEFKVYNGENGAAGADGNAGADGILPALPVTPLSELITPWQFDEKLSTARDFPTSIPSEPVTQYHGIEMDTFSSMGSIVTIPVPEKGVYVFASGYTSMNPHTFKTIMTYTPVVDGNPGQPVYLINNERDDTPLVTDNATLVGNGRNLPFYVHVSGESGNKLTYDENGLFVAEGGSDGVLPALPGATVGGTKTVYEFAALIQAKLSLTAIPASPVSEIYTTSAPEAPAYLTVIPVEGKGIYVLASGYTASSPATFTNMMAYVPVVNSVAGTPVYIYNDSRQGLSVQTTLTGDGTTVSPLGVNISSASDNTLTNGAQGLYVAPWLGDISVEDITSTIVSITDIESLYSDLLTTDITEAKTTSWYLVSYPAYESRTGTVTITAIPTPTGKLIIKSGNVDGPDNVTQNIVWADKTGDNVVYITENSINLQVADGTSIAGTGKSGDPFYAKVSADESNALVLNAATTDNPGLFVPASTSLTRSTMSGNWSFGYADDVTAATACGLFGTSPYMKVTVELSNAPIGSVAVPINVKVQELPCTEDGTLIPYQVWTDYVTMTPTTRPKAIIWLVMEKLPTHVINTSTKEITMLYRGASATTTGLSDVPISSDTAYEPKYSLAYFYQA